MIVLGQIVGINGKRVEQDEIRMNGRLLGMAHASKGGGVSIHVYGLSEAILADICKALDERDGGAYPDRIVAVPKRPLWTDSGEDDE